MEKAKILVAFVAIIIIGAKSDSAVQRRTTYSKETGLTLSTGNKIAIKGAAKSLSSKVTELLLNRWLPHNSFTLLIRNNMLKQHMIDPKLYLRHGGTITPPSFLIPAAEGRFSGVQQVVTLENNPAGVLCFNSEPVADKTKIDFWCIIFNMKKKMFAVHSGTWPSKKDIAKSDLKKFYESFKSTEIEPVENTNGGFLFKEFGQVQLLAQMTSSEAPRLYFEVRDSQVTALGAALRKRVLVGLATSVALGALTSIATFAYHRITAAVGTTMMLENESTEKVPIVLEDPRWEQNGVDIHDIIPWRLASKDSCNVNLVSPFASGVSMKTFEKSSIALSFKIQGTDDRLVLAIWWGHKISKSIGKGLDSYSISWIPSPKNDEKLTDSLKDFVKSPDNAVEKFSASVIIVDNFQHFVFWQFPMMNPSSKKVETIIHVLTNMGDGRKNGMIVKIYATLPAKGTDPPKTIPPPKSYIEVAKEIPAYVA